MTSCCRTPIVLAGLVGLLAVAGPVAAQERPNVYLDCNGPNCDSTYYRTEIEWVNWVRDQAVADLHVIVTSESTGAGGRQYQFDVSGVGEYEDFTDQLFYQSLPTDSERETLDGIAHTLSVIFARFAAEAGIRGLVDLEGLIEETAATQDVVGPGDVDDPWNLWVFRLGASTNLDAESTSETWRGNASFSASRVTPTWKTDYDGRVNFTHREIERSDGTIFTDTRTDWNLDGLLVYSVATHWSVGVDVASGRLNRFNQDFRIEVRPAVEYSYFPYPEATRRSLTAFYEIGPTYRDYIEETLFGQTVETRWEQSLELEFSSRQAWGDASFSVTGSHYLHDFEQNNLSVNGNVDYRINRYVSVDGSANVQWVNDQLYLPAGDLTDEEILLRLQQRATDFTWGFDLGFSVNFGSIYNNVVNNRFGGGGGGFGGGFRGGRF